MGVLKERSKRMGTSKCLRGRKIINHVCIRNKGKGKRGNIMDTEQ